MKKNRCLKEQVALEWLTLLEKENIQSLQIGIAQKSSHEIKESGIEGFQSKGILVFSQVYLFYENGGLT